jgi:multidrug efflux system membrane fusion protein
VAASFAADEGRAEQGTLGFVDNSVDRSTGTIKLKAQFDNRDRRLWPGQFINVALTLTTQSGAVVIPSEAIQVGPEGQLVFIVKPDKRVEVRPVTVARTSEGEAIIAKGIEPGETVVREGQFLLGPGARVDIKKDASATDTQEPKKERTGKGKGKAQERGAS